MDGRRNVLEAEYARGTWDYLRGPEEVSRFSVVVGYCRYFNSQGSILEIGCGEGILQERLDGGRHRRYLGVDISAEAIARAARRQNSSTSFVVEDAQVFCPDEPFDVIVFNECLEYFADPLGLVRRYERFLAPGGIYIVSIFAGIDTTRSRKIWRMLESVYRGQAATRVTNEAGYTWTVKVFRPPSVAGGSIAP